eukprot:CAMPEP_0119319976 /NCGR_PEP_ID=MMETSP1333-20130426/51032_1 /TAXON_ID=418940 /ORGANISM="Scyphosphaera apsteinii, Strain RCC1455" /LENGTH=137 /DNA_ID=CAMNT_0007326555 /DNA_START=9 /DNA_END=422 /DNA_ORIENTATION=+
MVCTRSGVVSLPADFAMPMRTLMLGIAFLNLASLVACDQNVLVHMRPDSVPVSPEYFDLLPSEQITEEEEEEAFQSIDKNGDGFIERDEVMEEHRRRLSGWTKEEDVTEPEELKTFFDRYDLDGNGKVSLDEILQTK